MSLRKKQTYFAWMLAELLMFAKYNGYEVTFCPEHENHIKSSLHFKALAKDLNLFKNGKYLRKTKDHEPLGVFWESLGGTWGGRFKNRDGNHYSLAHKGVK